MARTRLRRRILSMTLIYSVMLIGVVFILTWRTNQTQTDIERIVGLQTRALDALTQFKVLHAGARSQWQRAADEGPDAFVAAANRYLVLSSQSRGVLSDAGAATDEIVTMSEGLDQMVRDTAARWPSLSVEEQRHSLATIVVEADYVVQRSDAAITRSKAELDNRLHALVRDGRNTMWTALGSAYIVAIISIAVTMNALKKIARPLEELWHAALRIAKGEYEARAPVGGDREVAQLGQAFNEMAGKIEAALEATEQRASTDDLTKLPNFRSFSESMKIEIERAERYDQRFGLLIFDIDHFKKYNDTYGHLAGNEALQLVSATIRSTLRNVDLPARYGGEEFAAILPEVDEAGMHKTSERTRKAIAALAPIEGRRRITVSIGGAIFPDDGRTAEQLFSIADERLYEAKEGGRNRVVTPRGSAVQKSAG